MHASKCNSNFQLTHINNKLKSYRNFNKNTLWHCTIRLHAPQNGQEERVSQQDVQRSMRIGPAIQHGGGKADYVARHMTFHQQQQSSSLNDHHPPVKTGIWDSADRRTFSTYGQPRNPIHFVLPSPTLNVSKHSQKKEKKSQRAYENSHPVPLLQGSNPTEYISHL